MRIGTIKLKGHNFEDFGEKGFSIWEGYFEKMGGTAQKNGKARNFLHPWGTEREQIMQFLLFFTYSDVKEVIEGVIILECRFAESGPS